MTWAELSLQVEACQKCPLQGGNPVLGSGNLGADIMVIGEAPGREEASRGVPFVGASGRRLDQLLPLAKLRREDLYLTNTLLHRPPDNRTPYVGEQKACRAFLDEQLALDLHAGSPFALENHSPFPARRRRRAACRVSACTLPHLGTCVILSR